jgi:hypothetical protein
MIPSVIGLFVSNRNFNEQKTATGLRKQHEALKCPACGSWSLDTNKTAHRQACHEESRTTSTNDA